MTYMVSGGGWVLGYGIFIPWGILMTGYNVIVTFYSFTMVLFNNLNFELYFRYPFRRLIVQQFYITVGLILLIFPGISALTMPFLGLFAINDFLDYPGWNNLSSTLGIPFNSFSSSNTS